MAKAKKPRFVAHEKTFMAVEVLTKKEKTGKTFMRVETGTSAMASDGKGPKKIAPKTVPEETEEIES